MARETINGFSVPVPGTGEPADFVADLRRVANELPASSEKQFHYAGNRTVFLGDSITASGDGAAAPGGGQWSSVVTIRSGARIFWARNAGIGGNTTAQMLARISTDVLAYDPDVVVVLGGTNDANVATAQAGLTGIYDALEAADVRAVACTIPPSNSDPFGKPATLNAWIKQEAASRGMEVIDFYSALTSPKDGKYYSAFTTDGTHPTAAGHDQMAGVALAQLLPRYPAWRPYLAPAQVDSGNLVPLPLLVTNRLLGDGFTEQTDTPRGYANFLGSGVTAAMVTAAGVPGRMQELTIPKTATGSSSVQMLKASTGANEYPIAVTPGHRVRFSIRLQTENALVNGVKVTAYIDFSADSSGTGAVGGGGLNQSSEGEFADGVWSQDLVVPAGKTNARVGWGASAPSASAVGTTKVRFGQPTVVDLGPA